MGAVRVWKAVLLGVLPFAGPALAADAPPDAAPPAPPPAAQEMIYKGEATSILGRTVMGPDGKTVGRIIDLLVDDYGQPRAAVVDVGGFMGIGNRHIAVAWRSLRFEADQAEAGRISLDMTEAQIAGTPAFQHTGKPVAVAVPPPAPGGPAPP